MNRGSELILCELFFRPGPSSRVGHPFQLYLKLSLQLFFGELLDPVLINVPDLQDVGPHSSNAVFHNARAIHKRRLKQP